MLERISTPVDKKELDQEAVRQLEKLLDTSFTNLGEFFALDTYERTFDVLAKNHSDIYIDHELQRRYIDYPRKSVSVFPPLLMTIQLHYYGNGYHDYFINFQTEGEKHEEVVDFEYPQLMFEEINKKIKSHKFVQFDGGSWFMTPKDLDVEELCDLTGYIYSPLDFSVTE